MVEEQEKNKKQTEERGDGEMQIENSKPANSSEDIEQERGRNSVESMVTNGINCLDERNACSQGQGLAMLNTAFGDTLNCSE